VRKYGPQHQRAERSTVMQSLFAPFYTAISKEDRGEKEEREVFLWTIST